jgi:hypothetical protein
MVSMLKTPQSNRYGFYYYPDTLHYRETDLHIWLPELKSLGASWITLLASADRAIPESFIRSIIAEGITPIIHLPLPTDGRVNLDDLSIIFDAYSHWGLNYISLFDRPNLKRNWPLAIWAQKYLVERFLDLYLPIANLVQKAGLTPGFPALEPGGDYWDTAFLYTALQGLQRRGEQDLLDQMVLSAYAWSGNRSLNWGAGGPERWPKTRPYATPQNSQDQLGFRIFDWYLAISQAVLGKRLPIILLGAGSKLGDQSDPEAPILDFQAHTWQNLTLINIMSGHSQEYDPVPSEVLTCNFWLMAAELNDPEACNAWYQHDKENLPIVAQLKEWVSNAGDEASTSNKKSRPYSKKIFEPHPLSHYLLLLGLDVSDAGWHFEEIRPFINKYHPTIGFSPVEASHAKRVTVFGGSSKISETIIDGLLAAGCVVEQINGDGMNIATDVSTFSK